MYYNFFDGFSGSAGSAGAAVAVMLAVYAVFMVIAFVIGAVSYVFQSLGLFALGKNRGLKSYGLAWVPVGYMWILGGLADDYDRKCGRRENKYRYWLLWLNIGACVLMTAGAVTMAVAGVFEHLGYGGDAPMVGAMVFAVFAYIFGCGVLIACAVMEYIALHKIYRSCRPDNAVLYTVLSVVFSITIPFFLFASRNSNYGMPAPEPEEPEAQEPETPELEPAKPLAPAAAPEAQPEDTEPSDGGEGE